MKKIFLSMLALLILPIIVSAEENDGSLQTTNDDIAVIKLYETDENGKEIKVSGPTKNGDDFIYSVTLGKSTDTTYYYEIKPNYEYSSISYKEGGSNGNFTIPSNLSPYFTCNYMYSAGSIEATVKKTDGSTVKYILSVLRAKETVYVEDNDESNQISNVTNTTTVDTTSEQQIPKEETTKEETIENPKTGIVIGSGVLLIGFVSILTLQKKNKFNKI